MIMIIIVAVVIINIMIIVVVAVWYIFAIGDVVVQILMTLDGE